MDMSSVLTTNKILACILKQQIITTGLLARQLANTDEANAIEAMNIATDDMEACKIIVEMLNDAE